VAAAGSRDGPDGCTCGHPVWSRRILLRRLAPAICQIAFLMWVLGTFVYTLCQLSRTMELWLPAAAIYCGCGWVIGLVVAGSLLALSLVSWQSTGICFASTEQMGCPRSAIMLWSLLTPIVLSRMILVSGIGYVVGSLRRYVGAHSLFAIDALLAKYEHARLFMRPNGP
jgi:hypothetical protein